MSFTQELSSWWAPKAATEIAKVPIVGSQAPNTANLDLSDPPRPTILVFLRHCGCPFAEKTFLNFRDAAKANKYIDFIAVSHSSEESTQTWLASLPQAGSEPDNLRVIVDEQVEIYSAYGLGASGYGHVLSPASMYNVWQLGKSEGIWNRPTESGSRWQTGGFFAVDGDGIVRWGRAANRADEIPDFEAMVEALATEKIVKGSKL
ncbi:hypothetical protein LTR10_006682 [Elasticomyces elasticus]|nr:hypothetical protein LTR10_006682 [Elasticomyces elasticus]KAK4972916.1 hypothetical protein LTR42_006210 [Elasticomyces elasticus]